MGASRTETKLLSIVNHTVPEVSSFVEARKLHSFPSNQVLEQLGVRSQATGMTMPDTPGQTRQLAIPTTSLSYALVGTTCSPAHVARCRGRIDARIKSVMICVMHATGPTTGSRGPVVWSGSSGRLQGRPRTAYRNGGLWLATEQFLQLSLPAVRLGKQVL